MAIYNIYYENVLNAPADTEAVSENEETIEGEGQLEISDAEVAQIVALLKKHKGKQDDALEEMQSIMPDVYGRMDKAFRALAMESEERYWLYRGVDERRYEVNVSELLEYCRDNCGFICETTDEISAVDLFGAWLEKYVRTLPYDDFRDFAFNQLNMGVNLDDVKYEIEIPVEIVIKAQ